MLYLMSKDTLVAKFENNFMQVENEDLLPLYFEKHTDLNEWLRKRAIDSHRTNSRLLKKALRLAERDDVSTVLKFNAATITDTYWVKDDHSKLTYEDVRFKTNFFDTLALRGDLNAFNQDSSRTPELTNTGSFEKCWRLINNEWWMYKSGSNDAYFSELFICEFSKKMGFPTAEYEMDGGYIRTKDFTESGKYNHEPMSSLIDDDEDYSNNFNLIYSINPKFAADYLKLIYTDTICYNVDRHTENYGFLRNPDTGKIVSLSPNYDNNIALVSNGPLKSPTSKDALIQFYMDFLKNNRQARSMFKSLNIQPLSKQEIEECLNEVPIESKYDIVDIISKRQEIFWDAFQQMYSKSPQTIKELSENSYEKPLKEKQTPDRDNGAQNKNENEIDI